MTPTQFIERVLVTESNGPEVGQRIKSFVILTVLKGYLEEAIKIGEKMDGLKKAIFYGKVKADNPAAHDLKVAEVNSNIGLASDLSLSSELSARLDSEMLVRLLHGAIGTFTESTEKFEALHTHIFQGKDLDLVNVAEEIGDGLWYAAVELDAIGLSFEKVMDLVIFKLMSRYEGKFKEHGFSETGATIRDLARERKVMVEYMATNGLAYLAGKPGEVAEGAE